MPDSASIPLLDDLAPLLATGRLGRVARGFEEIDSTNAHALAWAAGGAPEGALVCAEAQTKGRGRFRRAWEAEPGRNLLFSVVLRPGLAPERFGLIPLAAGVAVAEAAEAVVAPERVRIKWPNDVLIDGRKACGILIETTLRAGAAPAVVLGIGLNVNQAHFPPHLAGRATSLRLASGRVVDRAGVLAGVLNAFEPMYDGCGRDGGRRLRAAYQERLAGRGETVTVHPASSGAPVTGRVLGIAADGALRLRVGETVRTFHAAETTLDG